MKKLFLAVIFAALWMGGASVRAQSPDESTGILKYQGVEQQIRLGEIARDEKGQLTVEITGELKLIVSDLDNNLIMNGLAKLAMVKVTAGGKSVTAGTFSVPAGALEISVNEDMRFVATAKRLVYDIPTTLSPEKVTVYNELDSVTFDAIIRKVAR